MSGIRKCVVIGLDGLEPSLVEAMVARGELRHLESIQRAGGYSRVQTTYPAQTPVAWSSFATGTNPGGHGIFDFISRDPATYTPDLSLNRFEQKNPFLPPKAVNLRRGTPLWSLLSEAGIPSAVLRCPCTFPPDKFRGRMLSGMGVPDLRGGLGTPTFYSTASVIAPGESEQQVKLDRNGNSFGTYLVGPRHPKTRADIHYELRFDIDAANRSVRVVSDGQPRELVVKVGEWSDWLKVKFKVGLLQGVHGMVRFHLVRLEPELEIYASPVNFDPEAALLYPLAEPPEYAKDLARATGTFYTTGMVEDHGGLTNERFDEAAYLDQCSQVLAERERMLQHELERLDQGLVFCLFDTPDRIQHMFWRFREDGHPANTTPFSPEMRQVIEDHYRECDAIVGRALAHTDDETLVVVLSDHGFGSFQRGFNINTWLHEHGYLALKEGIEPGEGTDEFFHGVDWSRTKAYALGIGSVYLNLANREGNGIVKPGEAPALARELAEHLTGLADPERGAVAIHGVATREELYRGPYADASPDLVVRFADGYRASWATALGGVARETFEDNVKKWGGDHIIDPALVPGVLFMNRPFPADDPSLLDLAPTILSAFGVPSGPAMEGSSLL